MFNVPQNITQFVPLDAVLKWHNYLGPRRTLLNELRTTPGCEHLVEVVATEIAGIEKALAGFEAAIAPIAEARAKLEAAAVSKALATAVHEAGAEGHKKALKLRDDREVAESRHRAACREFERARSGLPMLGDPPTNAAMLRGRDIVEAMAVVCRNRIFKSGRSSETVADETWHKWLDLDESWLAWCPLFVERICGEAQSAWKKHERPNTVWKSDEIQFPDPADLREMWNELLADRVAWRHGKVVEAKRRLAQAEQEAAQ